jgi:hypothetical protein
LSAAQRSQRQLGQVVVDDFDVVAAGIENVAA